MGTLNKRGWLVVLRDGAALTAFCAAAALLVNAFRPDGIPVIENKEYQIYVPCPETLGKAEAVSPSQLLSPGAGKVLIVDGRSREAFDAWHVPGAVSIPFDYLMPVSAEDLNRVAASGAAAVVVYGDGEDPDCGEELARELAGNGIRNVRFVKGGAPAIRKAGKGGAGHE